MKYFLLLLTFFSFQIGFSQDEKPVNDEKVILETQNYDFSSVGVKPEFPGGIEAFYKFIGSNFRTPEVKGFKGGRLIVTFVIEKDGSIVDVKTIRDLGYGTTQEAIRVLQNSPKWKPGEFKGRIVRVMYTLPITLQPI
jgi:protein TonB